MTQSRIASLMASFNVAAPAVTGTTVAPRKRIRATLSACRSMSTAPMYTTHSQPKRAADRGRGDAVLARAGFGDDALLAHAPGEQDLAERVVDLVRAGVQEVFALEINFRAAEFFGQAFGEIKRRGPPGEIGEQRGEFRLERGVLAGAGVFVGEIAQRES